MPLEDVILYDQGRLTQNQAHSNRLWACSGSISRGSQCLLIAHDIPIDIIIGLRLSETWKHPGKLDHIDLALIKYNIDGSSILSTSVVWIVRFLNLRIFSTGCLSTEIMMN